MREPIGGGGCLTPGEQTKQREDQKQGGQDQNPGVPPRHLLQLLPQPAGHQPPVLAGTSLRRTARPRGRQSNASAAIWQLWPPASPPSAGFSGCRVPGPLLRHHIIQMPKMHPHAEAAYRVVSLAGGYFGVEVVIPETHPTTVSKFATEAEAEEWIARHKSRVQAEVSAQRWFRRARPR